MRDFSLRIQKVCPEHGQMIKKSKNITKKTPRKPLLCGVKPPESRRRPKFRLTKTAIFTPFVGRRQHLILLS